MRSISSFDIVFDAGASMSVSLVCFSPFVRVVPGAAAGASADFAVVEGGCDVVTVVVVLMKRAVAGCSPPGDGLSSSSSSFFAGFVTVGSAPVILVVALRVRASSFSAAAIS